MFFTVKNLTKTYKGRTAVADINIDLDKGQLLCLLGPSGCGKSTILHAIGGFVTLDAGQITLDGRDITALAPEEREVSTVFQSYGLFPHMNVLENICYGLKFKSIAKKDIRQLGLEMIDKMNLTGYADKQVHQLSGGEQQRVALGRSLIVKPKLLLLDEPLSNLDAKLRVSMREEIRRIQRDFGVTMIFVTHDQHEAFEIADQIVLLNQGEIMQVDTPAGLYNRPRNAFALDFIGHSNQLADGYVRPEQIQVSRRGPGQPAVVQQIVFQGAFINLILTTPAGQLTATVLNQGQDFAVGDDVMIQYQPRVIG